MTERPSFPPKAMLRRRRLVRSLVGLAVFLGSVLTLADYWDGRDFGRPTDGETIVTARVLDSPEGQSVRYRHPVTKQMVTAPLDLWSTPRPADGAALDIVVGHSPMYVEALGDQYFPHANRAIYVELAVIVVLLVGRTRWNEHRIRRLGQPDQRSVPMLATVSNGRYAHSVVLNLYSPDALEGEFPRCCVPLAVIPTIGFDVKFQVEVAGRPARFRRVVAAAGDYTLWPMGPARWSGRHQLPPGGIHRLDVAQEVSRPVNEFGRSDLRRTGIRFAVLCGIALAIIAFVTVLSTRNSADSREFISRAEPVVGKVIGHPDGSEIEFRIVDDNRRVQVIDDYYEDLPVGLKRELWVDPNRSVDRAFLVGYSHDLRAPIIASSIPLALIILWEVRRCLARRRVRRAMQQGPWRSFNAVVGTSTGSWLTTLLKEQCASVTLLDSRASPIASLPLHVGLPHIDQSVMTKGQRTVIIAGELAPGEATALWPSSNDSALETSPIRPPIFTMSQDPCADGEGSAGERSVRLDLASYRFKKQAEILIQGDWLTVIVPGWFGKTPWRIRISDVAVQDLTQPDQGTEVIEAEEPVFSKPVLVPYLYTTGQNAPATLALYFKIPQRVPPIRWSVSPWMSDWRDSRSAKGLKLDGVALRTLAPDMAYEALRDAGAEPVTNSSLWWRQHRSVVHDDSTRSRILRQTLIVRWLRRLRGLVLFAAIGARYFAGDLEDNTMFALVMGLIGAVAATSVLTWSLERRYRRINDDEASVNP